MSDEVFDVNSIVTAHAAKIKEQDTSGQNQENKNEGGLGADKPAADKPDGTAKPQEKVPENEGVSALLKELGIESIDVLKDRLKPKDAVVEETPEQKEKNESLYRANLQTYAVQEGLMKLDDFAKMENLKGVPDKDLVFNSMKDQLKDEVLSEDAELKGDELETAIKEAFEKEFPLESKNEKVKTRAENKLKREASEIRQPYQKSYEKSKQLFDNDLDLRKSYPEFSKKINGLVSENIPEKFNVFKDKDGEEDISIEVELTEKDKKEILEKVAKKAENPNTYALYKKGELATIQQLVKQETETFMWDKYRGDGLKKVAETFLSRGTKKGSTVGATQPFALNQSKPTGEGGKRSRGDKEQEVLDSLEGKK